MDRKKLTKQPGTLETLIFKTGQISPYITKCLKHAPDCNTSTEKKTTHKLGGHLLLASWRGIIDGVPYLLKKKVNTNKLPTVD